MGQVFRSGAFLQQCWSVHPLCVAVKRMAAGNQLILACTSCRFAHYLRLDSIEVTASAVAEGESRSAAEVATPVDGQALLVGCLDAHGVALSLRDMDVFEDLALLRCAECRRHYALHIASFETHQK
jgi:hypothetical protein